jgi:hypothetical protein
LLRRDSRPPAVRAAPPALPRLDTLSPEEQDLKDLQALPRLIRRSSIDPLVKLSGGTML